ncbi:MAG: hypothetical protein ACLTYW_09695 [Collinsella sp.]
MSTFLNASPIFGPVRSRRLGLSLGVNMMPASGKICTFDCIYCENGLNAERPAMSRTTRLPWYSTRSRQSCARWQPRASSRCDHLRRQRRAHRRTGVPQAIAGAVALRDELAPNPRSPCSPTARAPTARVHDALMMVDDNILKLDTVDPAFIQLLDQPVGPTTSSTRLRRSQALTVTLLSDDLFDR